MRARAHTHLFKATLVRTCVLPVPPKTLMSLLPARLLCAPRPGVSTRKPFCFEVLERDSGVPLPRGSSRWGEGAGRHANGGGIGSSSETQLSPRVMVKQATNQSANRQSMLLWGGLLFVSLAKASSKRREPRGKTEPWREPL